jgi:hypothetical protein
VRGREKKEWGNNDSILYIDTVRYDLYEAHVSSAGHKILGFGISW